MVLRAWILTAVSLLETMYLKVQQLIMVQQIPAGTSLCQCELSSTFQGNLLNNLTNVLKWSIFWTTGMCCGNAKCCDNTGMSVVNTPTAVLSSRNHVWNVSMFTQINITSFPFWNILDLRTYCLRPIKTAIICHSLLTIIIFVLQTYTRRCEKHICGNFWWGNLFVVLAFFIVPSIKCQ